jgi:hypothetical protein
LCGYYRQIWLSRSSSSITGFKNKKNKCNKNDILFEFENIKGFSVDYELWHYALSALIGYDDNLSFEDLNLRVEDYVNNVCEQGYDDGFKNYDDFIEKLFTKSDQVVLPSLNLKSAKKVICRNEKDKKKLRKMGFIEDRIKIKNIKRWK